MPTMSTTSTERRKDSSGERCCPVDGERAGNDKAVDGKDDCHGCTAMKEKKNTHTPTFCLFCYSWLSMPYAQIILFVQRRCHQHALILRPDRGGESVFVMLLRFARANIVSLRVANLDFAVAHGNRQGVCALRQAELGLHRVAANRVERLCRVLRASHNLTSRSSPPVMMRPPS